MELNDYGGYKNPLSQYIWEGLKKEGISAPFGVSTCFFCIAERFA